MLIKDLRKELDTEGMAAVRGGNNGAAVDNTIGQQLGIVAPTALLAAGPANTNVDVSGSQYADIYSVQHAGDTFALLPFVFGRPVLR
jgi:hypothetical protein